jgi:uncharacterized metal-binding protein YceD (DUF177 family)
VIIRLNDIPDAGENFHWDTKHRDLKNELIDVIGQEEYDVQLYIKPQDGFYLMSGSIKTTAPELCSKCGTDIKIPLSIKVNEILIPETQLDRKDHQAQSAYDYAGTGPEMTEVRNDQLDGGQFVHQAIILALPMIPKCPESCQPLVELSAESPEILKNNPFTVLKSLKN